VLPVLSVVFAVVTDKIPEVFETKILFVPVMGSVYHASIVPVLPVENVILFPTWSVDGATFTVRT